MVTDFVVVPLDAGTELNVRVPWAPLLAEYVMSVALTCVRVMVTPPDVVVRSLVRDALPGELLGTVKVTLPVRASVDNCCWVSGRDTLLADAGD